MSGPASPQTLMRAGSVVFLAVLAAGRPLITRDSPAIRELFPESAPGLYQVIMQMRSEILKRDWQPIENLKYEQKDKYYLVKFIDDNGLYYGIYYSGSVAVIDNLRGAVEYMRIEE